MARTAKMKLAELMVLKQDIDLVLAFLGKEGNFQFIMLWRKWNASKSCHRRYGKLFSLPFQVLCLVS